MDGSRDHRADYNKIDQQILEILKQEGNQTAGSLNDSIDTTRQTVYNHLRILETQGIVECIHQPTSLWRLVEDEHNTDREDH